MFVEENRPTDDGNGWYDKLVSVDPEITVYVNCGTPQ